MTVILPALCVAACIAALAAAGAGCGKRKAQAGEPSPLLHTAAPHAEKIDVARAATDAAELRRALLRPHSSAATLGAHRFQATSKIRVTEAGTQVEALDVTESYEQAESGAFHLVAKNSKDYGREAFHVDGTLWIRPGYGKFHRRAPGEPNEPARLLDETFATLGADYDLVARAADLTDGGAVTVAGRPAHKITFALADRTAPVAAAGETLPQHAWRASATVLALAGEVALDKATGLPLTGTITARVSFVREGHTYEMTLEATHQVTDVGGAIAVAPPGEAESVDTPQRSRDFEDREELLHGIAPAARRGPVPEAGAKAAP